MSDTRNTSKHRFVATAFLVGLTISCENRSLPTDSREKSPTFEVSTADDARISEDIEFTFAFEDPGKSKLAGSGSIRGNDFGLRFEQSFDAAVRVATLRMNIENVGFRDIWRPLRVEVVAIKPSSVFFMESDNNVRREGSRWDYGQSTGLSGKVGAGGITEPRTIQIQAPGKNEASLQSVVLTVRITGSGHRAFAPTPIRDGTGAEAQEGFGAGMVLVRYHEGVLDPVRLARINLQHRFAGQEYDPALAGYIAFTEEPTFDAARQADAELREDAAVEQATLAYVAVPLAIDLPAASEIGYAFELGGFRNAWTADRSAGHLPGEGVVVGVLDSGIDTDGDEFLDRVATAVDVRLSTPDGIDPEDHFGHGTEVAGVIAAAANGHLVVGGAYGARIASVKIYNQEKDLAAALFPWNVLRGLDFVLQHSDIGVVSISWGQHCTIGGLCSLGDAWGLNDRIRAIVARGTLVIAGAGNCDVDNVMWPARLPEVIAVAGTMRNGQSRWSTGVARSSCPLGATEGSSYGPEVDVAAPAEDIRVVKPGSWFPGFPCPSGCEATASGTSLAAPQVAAVAAILKARNASASSAVLRDLLLFHHTVDIGDPGSDKFFGFGRVFAGELPATVLRQLTTGPGSFASPSISTLGSTITFTNQYSFLSVIGADGQNLRTFPFGSAEERISGDGRRIVFFSFGDPAGDNPDGNAEIFAIDADGSNAVQLTHSFGIWNRHPVIDERGVGVVFESAGDLTGDNADGSRQLFWVRSDGTALRQITHTQGSTNQVSMVPEISPDGARVVFQSTDNLTGENPFNEIQIYVIDADGANLRQVIRGSLPSIGGPPYRIAFIDARRIISVTYADGTGLRQLTSAAFPALSSEVPLISADNSRLVFASPANHTGENADGHLELFVAQSDGSALRQITHSTQAFVDADRPSISGDGTKIAFQWMTSAGLPQIFIATVPR